MEFTFTDSTSHHPIYLLALGHPRTSGFHWFFFSSRWIPLGQTEKITNKIWDWLWVVKRNKWRNLSSSSSGESGYPKFRLDHQWQVLTHNLYLNPKWLCWDTLSYSCVIKVIIMENNWSGNEWKWAHRGIYGLATPFPYSVSLSCA